MRNKDFRVDDGDRSVQLFDGRSRKCRRYTDRIEEMNVEGMNVENRRDEYLRFESGDGGVELLDGREREDWRWRVVDGEIEGDNVDIERIGAGL